MNSILMNQAIQAFLLEDIGQHDLSAETVFPVTQWGKVCPSKRNRYSLWHFHPTESLRTARWKYTI